MMAAASVTRGGRRAVGLMLPPHYTAGAVAASRAAREGVVILF